MKKQIIPPNTYNKPKIDPSNIINYLINVFLNNIHF